jgi:hypothetical protein
MSHGEILGIAIGIVAIILVAHGHHVTFANWLLVGFGLLGAGLIKRYAAPYLGATFNGVAVLGFVGIAVYALFYARIVRGSGSQKYWWADPLLSFAFGAAVILCFSAAGQLILPAGHVPITTGVVTHG